MISHGRNGDGAAVADPEADIPFIPLSYTTEPSASESSARALILALRPEWGSPGAQLEFVRFTDGITNTLLKAVNRAPDLSPSDVDREAILLRAYGHGTDLIIDRQREAQNHELLMRHGLAPELLARFHNGMMYRFIRGRVSTPADLRRPAVYRGVARRLATWHAVVPCIPGRTTISEHMDSHCRAALADGAGAGAGAGGGKADLQSVIDNVAPGKAAPNMWTVMQKWLLALPHETEAQRARQAQLQAELDALVKELSQRPGLGKDGLVFAHCDLLSGNVIVLPANEDAASSGIAAAPGGADKAVESVTFIDYEYATPSPAAFDIANHFAEWGGFDCDYGVLPTRPQRRDFIAEYVRAYSSLLPSAGAGGGGKAGGEQAEVDRLMAEVDLFRGLPGFYWGIWALIQATISEIDFDYASYAETRLGEYWAWRAERDGSRAAAGGEAPLREKRWAQDE